MLGRAGFVATFERSGVRPFMVMDVVAASRGAGGGSSIWSRPTGLSTGDGHRRRACAEHRAARLYGELGTRDRCDGRSRWPMAMARIDLDPARIVVDRFVAASFCFLAAFNAGIMLPTTVKRTP